MRNLIDYSSFKTLRYQLPFRGFSIKYVVAGCEYYTINGNRYAVHAGQYLLANHHASGFVEINSMTPVKGICIQLSTELIQEAVASHLRPDTAQVDLTLDRFFSTPAFYENRYEADQTRVGRVLHHLERRMSAAIVGRPEVLDQELYFDLAGRIVADHVPVFRQLQAIPSLKTATKKDLFRKLERAKSYLDDCFGQSPEIQAVARESFMSEYHFYRLFKRVYGCSPYQYALQRRLDQAHTRIRQGGASITEIAEQSGYADVQAFSKAFKNRFGISPRGVVGGTLNW